MATGTYDLVATKGSCSALGSVIVDAQPATPGAPSLCISQQVSLCGSATGSITVTNPTDIGNFYSIDNGSTWQSSTVFSNLSAGSNPSILVKNAAGCVSATATSCSSAAANCSGLRIANETTTSPASTKGATPIKASTPLIDMAPIHIDLSSSQTTVKAFPNPFRNKVRFVITSEKAGNGILEIFNTIGQKNQTIYQGLISPGINNFEWSLLGQHSSNLVYRFRMGDKKITGKLIQINQ